MPNYQDNFCDYDGVKIKVEWNDKLWKKHLSKHPELQNQDNTSKLISDSISKPSLVLRGKKPGDGEMLICYYKECRKHQNDVYYIKTVVGCNQTPFYVKTVFMSWALSTLAIQESKYNFKEIFRDPKTVL
jgi:hypothetical protein